MAEYIDRMAIPYAKLSEFDKGSLTTRATIESLPTADVIERSEHDRAVQAFKVLVEIKNGNLVAMQEKYYALEKEYAELKVNIDKAIEEIRQECIEVDYHANMLLGSSHGMRKAIEILKRNIGE